MNKPKFTKSPWVVLPEELDKDYIRIRGTQLGERYKIADVHNISYTCIPNDLNDLLNNESEANANLMACSPEMYDMLYVASCALGENHSGLQESIWELLKKARGEK